MPVTEHFWAKVDQSDNCWLWTAAHRPAGYGTYYVDRYPKLAHRVAWELTYGDIPTEMYVCHTCDNPPCVRPDHLFLGSRADNTADARHKGRLQRTPGALIRCEWCGTQRYYDAHRARGRRYCSTACQRAGNRKLTENIVRDIRDRLAEGRESLAVIGRAFGVSQSMVWQIAHRKAWAHVLCVGMTAVRIVEALA